MSGRSIPALLVALLLGRYDGVRGRLGGRARHEPQPEGPPHDRRPDTRPAAARRAPVLHPAADRRGHRRGAGARHQRQRHARARAVGRRRLGRLPAAAPPRRLRRAGPAHRRPPLRPALGPTAPRPRALLPSTASPSPGRAPSGSRWQPTAGRFLHRIWRTECTARRIARARPSVRYGDTWTVEGTGPRACCTASSDLRARRATNRSRGPGAGVGALRDGPPGDDRARRATRRARPSRSTSPPGGAATSTRAARAPRRSSSGSGCRLGDGGAASDPGCRSRRNGSRRGSLALPGLGVRRGQRPVDPADRRV